jgi:tetraacyldisaccharide 4'-kinase
MREPHFWQVTDRRAREGAPLTRALLTPLGWLYASAGARRIARTVPFEAGVPVVGVGNLTLGGAGKTPVARAVRARLAGMGLSPATLSRGHGGRLRGPLAVDPQLHAAADVGDEPLLLAQDGAAWISRDRPAGARAMVASGVTAIVMDDGHQNPSLAKTLSLVVIDAARPFGNGCVFPAGPLREPVAVGLARADAVVLMGDGEVALPGFSGPVLRAHLAPLRAPPEGPLLAFAGIGRPAKFFDALTAQGAQVVDAVSFADHHPFTDAELSTLADLARTHNARLITTEKDLMRLSPHWRAQVAAWPVEAVFDEAAALDDLLARAVESAR